MNLDTTLKVLQIVLGEAKTTNDCDITTSYADSTSSSFTLGNNNVKSNGTTVVTVVAAPGDSATQRQVKEVRLFNNDTVSHTVTLQLYDGTSTWIIGPGKQTVPVGASFIYTPDSAVGASGSGVVLVVVQAGPFLASGTITTSGTINNSITSLTANAILLGAGTAAVAPLGSLGTATTVLHGNVSGPPTFGPVALAADVSGLLPFANFGTLAPSSLFGNAATIGATGGNIAIGANITLSPTGTLSVTAPGTGTVTQVVAQGGPFLANGTITATGTINNSVASLTPHGVVLAEGTSAVVATAAGTDGQLLIATSAADPAFTSMTGDATITKAGAITVTKAGGTTIPTVPGLGININGATISAHNQITIAATAGINPITPTGSLTSVLVNGPAAGGSCTLTVGAASGVDQSIKINISQGATAATWTLGTGFAFGTTIPSFTATAVAGKRDVIAAICNVGTVFDVAAVLQGM